MYQVVKKGDEFDLFTHEVLEALYRRISEEIVKMLSQTENPKPAILGAFAVHNVPMSDGSAKNVWIEYNGFIVGGMVDAGVHQCIIYDEIPDIILDRYNNMKALLFEEIQDA
jgi:hypothetical protein